MPTLFCLVILFLIWFTYERKKNDTDYSKSKAFWDREQKASYVPRASMDDIEFITIPEDAIPASRPEFSEELRDAINELRSLSSQQICDLSEYSNTDLKLKYGTGNFMDLSKADNNYTRLVQWSGKLLTRLDEEGYLNEAASYMEFLRQNNITSRLLEKYLN